MRRLIILCVMCLLLSGCTSSVCDDWDNLMEIYSR